MDSVAAEEVSRVVVLASEQEGDVAGNAVREATRVEDVEVTRELEAAGEEETI